MLKQKETIEEIMRKQLSMVENKDRVVELEKQVERNERIIESLKQREKLSIRTISLFEKKLKFAKELVTSNILSITEVLNDTKLIVEDNAPATNLIGRVQMVASDLINEINKLTFISDEEKNFLVGDFVESKQNLQSRFDKLKSDYKDKIGGDLDRKPGRPKKDEQSIVSGLKLNQNVEKIVDENSLNASKFNDIFYKSPDGAKKYVSNIPKVDDSSFDFNEALNPNMSLSDIMSDIIGKEVKTDKKYDYLKDEKISKIENGEIVRPNLKEEIKDVDLDPKNKQRFGGIITNSSIFGKIRDL